MSADTIGRITKVVIHDWRGIKAVEYDIGPGGVVVEGTNGSGKTSFISGIRACLTGRGVDENAIRVGAEQAEIFVDHQHATVRRLLKANGGSSLKVTRDDGTTQASPQAWLNDVLGVSPLDPIDLMEEKDGAKRRAKILAAMPIAVSPAVLAQWLPPGETVPEADCKGHGLDVVERVRKLVYERRTEANRALKSVQAAVTEAGLKLATAEADLGSAPVRAKAVVDEELALAARARADIEARAQLAATTNASADRTRVRVADLRAEAAKLREAAGNMTPDATVLTKLIEAKAERTEEIEQHEHAIAQLQSKIAEVEADRENAIRRRAEMAEAVVTVGFSKSKEALDLGFARYKRIAYEVRKTRMLGSAALAMAYIATGRLDAYVEEQISLWDIAAGQLMVESGGGKVETKPSTTKPGTMFICATNGKLGIESYL